MHRLIIEFYCLPYQDLLVLFGIVTYCFLSLRQRFGNRRWWNCLVALTAAAWIFVIAMFTVSNRESGSSAAVFLVPFHSYREMRATGNIEILRSNIMNAILFYPAGVLTASVLPEKWPRWLRIGLIFLLFTAVSAGVEYYQYAFGLGRAEMDDVIHNAAGALFGALISAIVPLKKERD